ncbi:hypothetical protein [Latilactobacillus fragifolii]|uniref:hypothetical protein n=1 Tax=Latilactobacillus fragifolii TaxID=2814244 RepID=UPI001ABAAA6A|nr:hypothetical protein [Latilactobacillus fragifolii]
MPVRKTENLAIKTLVSFLRTNHRASISLVDYFEKQQISPKDRNALLSQIHRSEVVGIKYRYDGPAVKTMLFLKKQ